MATIKDLEQQFQQAAFEFNEARYLWHHYMNKHIGKHGMPSLYVGCVSYNHDAEYGADATLKKIKALPEEARAGRLEEEIEYLRKWKFPGKYPVALFTTIGKLVIADEEFNLQNVKFYDTYEDGGDIVYAIDIKYAGFRYISIPKEDKRSHIEMRGILGVCKNVDYLGHASYDDMEGAYPVDDPSLDKSLLSFEGVSLGLPGKDFMYAINHLDDTLPGGIKDINVSYMQFYSSFTFKSVFAGYKVDWSLPAHLKKYVYDTIMGDTDTIIGYENIREAYDKIVARFMEWFGEPTEVNDVPSDLRKNSIMKALRENEIKIETIFEKEHIYASVEIEVDEENKREGNIHLYASDQRLMDILRTRLKSAAPKQGYRLVDTKTGKKRSHSESGSEDEQRKRQRSSQNRSQSAQTQNTVQSKDSYDGCLITASLVVGIPLILLGSFLLAALMVGDSSDEYGWWVFGTFIFLSLIYVPMMIMAAKTPGRVSTYSGSSSSLGTGAALLGGAYLAHEAFDSDDEHSDFDIEDYRSVAEDRRFRADGSGNWTSREDWDCGPTDNYDGMSGWDSYEENDF